MKLLKTKNPIRGLITLLIIMTSITAFAQVMPISDEQAKSAGPGHPWQGKLPGVNLYSFAKQTNLPLVAWRARGGLPVAFALFHNSQAIYSNPALGPKWRHSYDIHLDRWNEAGVEKAALVWGNHLIQMFTLQGGQWVPADGYRDALENAGSGYRVRLKSQLLLEFESSPLTDRFRLKRLLDSNNNALNFTYDANGGLTTITDPNNRKLVLTYDALTNLMTKVKFQVGSWSRTWTILYDTSNRLNKIKYPPVTTDIGTQTFQIKLAYNSANNITSLTDRAGQVWKYAYDATVPDRLKSEQWPGNASTQKVSYTYSSAMVRKVKDPMGAEVSYFYDATGRVLTQVKDRLNNTTTLAYSDPDYSWMPSQITYPLSIQERYDYDATGNLVGYTAPSGSRWDYAYDSRNNLIRTLEPLVTDAWGVTEPSRHRTDYQFDSFDNLIAVRLYKDTTNYAETQYAYDVNGNCMQRTDALGKVTIYARDPYGNLTQVITPAGRTHTWFYSSAAQTHGFTVPNAQMDGTGVVISFLSDEWGRLRTADLPSGIDTTYSYDANSRLVKMVDSTGTTDWAYTPQGWLSGEMGAGMNVIYTYLPNGLRLQMETNSTMGMRTTNYTYDSLNRLVQLADNGMLNTFVYDAASRVVAEQLANGARTEYAYLHNRLSQVRHYNAMNLPFRSYNYDYQQNGLVRSAIELNGTVVRYGYDFWNRLVREERTGSIPYHHLWNYDDVGNRVMQNADGVLTVYQYDPDDLLMMADRMGSLTHYLHDAAGRMMERDRAGIRHQFMYDVQGRLTRINEWNGATYGLSRMYAYDGLNRRVQRQAFNNSVLAQTTRYLHDGSHPVVEEVYPAGGGLSTVWNVRAGELLAVHDTAAGSRWCATDGMGNLRGWTGMSGMDGSYQSVHNAFGTVKWESGSRPAYGWGADAGARSEGDAGLVYQDSVGWYDPIDRISIQEEPAIFRTGLVTDIGDLSPRISAAPLKFQEEPSPGVRPVQPLHNGCNAIDLDGDGQIDIFVWVIESQQRVIACNFRGSKPLSGGGCAVCEEFWDPIIKWNLKNGGCAYPNWRMLEEWHKKRNLPYPCCGK
jgi:YD repeat-containing protein